MRADARRNREQLLDVTVELILEVGGEPSRDAIAARAGVGIATLYRHFPDQQSLLHAVARHALERSIAAGEASVLNSVDSFDSLNCYMHAAIDHGIGVVNMVYPLLANPDWPDLRARAESLLDTIMNNAQADGKIRADLEVSDIVFATIRFGRPLAIGLSLADDRAIAHRHLDLYIAGLRTGTADRAQPRSKRGS